MQQSRVHLLIEERCAFADGIAFGAIGPYEILYGRARVEVAPETVPADSVIDLELAPRDSNGLIGCAADLAILKPADATAGNRRVLFDFPNRGSKRALQFFNDAPFSNRPFSAQHAGNGFLMRRGYTVVWIAWQGDLLPGDDRLLLDLPAARQTGAPILGTARSEFIVDEPGTRTTPLSGRVSVRSYPAHSLDKSRVTFTRRRDPDSEPIAIAPQMWDFAREEKGIGIDFRTEEHAVIPSPTHIRLKGGFEPGWIYQLSYEATDPLILGLGQIVVRDVIDYLKHRATDDSGAPNPLGIGTAAKVYAWGRSQTGRAIRDFIYRGYNEIAGRQVFDGAIINASGAGRLDFSRFANLNAGGSQQYEDHANPSDAFPFAYMPTIDPRSGRSDAILKRPASDPLIIHIQSSSEYWQRRGSLIHTDAAGNDLSEADNLRLYHWASSQHSSDPTAPQPRRGRFENLTNIVQTSFFFRALLDALDAWATSGRPPPASLLPRRRDGTLGSFGAWRASFPTIPGVTLPAAANAHGVFPVFVPLTDSDGNEIAGVRAPMVAAPLGTYTGWNIRAQGFGAGAMHSFNGSYIPLAETPEKARAAGDPRPSILERYASAEDYVKAIKAAADDLVRRDLMLVEDVESVVREAANWGRPRHDVQL
jgi:Alpha/beta hydrolase domain